jgi:predicted membrane metal-binding protein
MSEYDARSQPVEVSGWVTGGYAFAIVMLVIIGVFQAIAGLVAIIDDDFYVVGQNYTFNFDTSAWGWIHLLLGLLLILVGYFLYTGAVWAVVFAIVVAGISAIANFFFIPYYPFWSILVIALDIWVIWALTRPGVVARA